MSRQASASLTATVAVPEARRQRVTGILKVSSEARAKILRAIDDLKWDDGNVAVAACMESDALITKLRASTSVALATADRSQLSRLLTFLGLPWHLVTGDSIQT